MITIEAQSLIQKLVDARKSLHPSDPRMTEALTRIGILIEAKIIENIMRWKSRGYLWKTGAMVNSIGYRVDGNTLKVFSAGLPYAHVHEFGTSGKGGKLKDIVPAKPGGFLTIPMSKQYERKRARSFSNLQFITDKKKRTWLLDKDKNVLAYRLVKKVSIPARPYFFPAVEQTKNRRLQILRELLAIGGQK